MPPLPTFYAPAERANPDQIKKSNNLIINNVYLKDVFLAMPDVAVILNSERQIVFSNDALISLLPAKDIDDILGKRPGEAINCIHSAEHEGGCGTSESCRYCGAVNAILESQQRNEKVIMECRIVSFIEDNEVSFDFRVTANPFVIAGESYIMVFLHDISSEKRRIALERVFFHDIINTAGGIQGFVGFLNQVEDTETMKKYVKIVDQLSHDLVDEIQAQRALTMAENGELQVSKSELHVLDILNAVKNTVSYHVVAKDKEIVISDQTSNSLLISDSVLLKRVLTNMSKNALEATSEKGQIIMGCYNGCDIITFYVHNDHFMTREVQVQVFKRSFSTKGSDRGLGTYSIKLLTEKYLKGKVWFETREDTGTTFFAQLPCQK
ncbi:MAG: HAMP domain-containing histidine kinase [Bacteroidales bacterium]|nr:HAMP domain-containing histidine kinase [Bacteroidales bacterium]